MLIERIIFKFFCRRNNKARQKSIQIPDGIERKVDISYAEAAEWRREIHSSRARPEGAYGTHGKWNLLDVYFPKETDKPLPTIINIHGGGYVYGTKEESQYYCMYLAQRGFTVVNFSYHLAPKSKFPVPVIETNMVTEWVCSNAGSYFIDLNNIFITGDSAGAQIASQYSAIVTNPEYAALFDFNVPQFKLKAIALNCGFYDLLQKYKSPLPGLIDNYFGKDLREHGDKINVLKYINENYPPAFIMSSANDFLLPCARPMFEFLQNKGIESVCKIYGTEEQKEIDHVFHLNIKFPLSRQCNDEECEFFKKHISQ